jgi:Asp/Glu/hydantoin racemase
VDRVIAPSPIATGGKAVYGARVGILMLDTRFPRIPGDIGHADTWPFPALYRVVPKASPDLVVRRGAEGLLPAFLDAAEDLVRLGADGITTSCGFLAPFQKELAARAQVPVATSSLMQVASVQALLPPGRRVGVLTVDGRALTPAHLTAAGAPPDTPVMGTEGGTEFTRVLLGNEERLDIAAAEADLLAAGRALVATHPEVGALVLECTNMAPYSVSLRAALGLPVYDVVSFITWFHAGLEPRRFSQS